MYLSNFNSKVAIILLVAVCFVSGQVVGEQDIYCTTGGFCTDANCGNSGSTSNNWQNQLQSTTNCVIADCTKLTRNVSDNACYSCNSGKNANIYASADKTECVTFKSANGQLLLACLFILIVFLL